jgi:hypothetical protein
MIEKFAVLWTYGVTSTRYHLLFDSGKIIHDVYDHDRKADGLFYEVLHNIMSAHDLQVLWVHPDTPLSLWLQHDDFKLIPSGLRWFTPGTTNKVQTDRPYCIALGSKSDNHLVMFPAYAHLKHSNKESEQIWDLPTPDTLLHSVQYTQRALNTTLKWTAGATGLQLLREINSKSGPKITPMLFDRWGMVRSHTVSRPIWARRDVDSKLQGLSDVMCSHLFMLGGDKNAQFLGGCRGLRLPSGEPSEISNAQAIMQLYQDEKIPSLWEYEVQDVSNTVFNSYDLYCPLSKRDNWASGELLRYCEQVGIKFQIKRGLAWKEHAGERLSAWAEKIWFGISGLRNHYDRFPDVIARANALSTLKRVYVEAIGRFNDWHSKEYYQRAWNTLIIHRAIKNQMASIASRLEASGVIPPLVVNDAFYITSDETDLNRAFPGILEHSTELRGYKQIGVCPLSDVIIHAFTDKKPGQIESIIKQEMRAFADATL